MNEYRFVFVKKYSGDDPLKNVWVMMSLG